MEHLVLMDHMDECVSIKDHIGAPKKGMGHMRKDLSI